MTEATDLCTLIPYQDLALLVPEWADWLPEQLARQTHGDLPGWEPCRGLTVAACKNTLLEALQTCHATITVRHAEWMSRHDRPPYLGVVQT